MPIKGAPICTISSYKEKCLNICEAKKIFEALFLSKKAFKINFCGFFTFNGPLKIWGPRLQLTLPMRYCH